MKKAEEPDGGWKGSTNCPQFNYDSRSFVALSEWAQNIPFESDGWYLKCKLNIQSQLSLQFWKHSDLLNMQNNAFVAW